MQDKDWILSELEQMADPSYVDQMEYFGIKSDKSFKSLGIKHAVMRPFAKEIGKHQPLAESLWVEPVHEAKHMAIWLAEPKKFSEEVADKWTADAYSWDLVDGVGMKLIHGTNYAWDKVEEWSHRQLEFEKRMAFASIVGITMHQKKVPDSEILSFLPIIERESWDDRNFVKKAVNWALRTIGKRSLYLNELAIESAERIKGQDTRAARWIAADALRELNGDAVQARLLKKKAENKLRMGGTQKH